MKYEILKICIYIKKLVIGKLVNRRNIHIYTHTQILWPKIIFWLVNNAIKVPTPPWFQLFQCNFLCRLCIWVHTCRPIYKIHSIFLGIQVLYIHRFVIHAIHRFVIPCKQLFLWHHVKKKVRKIGRVNGTPFVRMPFTRCLVSSSHCVFIYQMTV